MIFNLTNFFISKKCTLSQKTTAAFTLAEILITLGVIGIVAVLTIPNLVAETREKGWDSSASNFEAKFGQALKVMNTQNTLAGQMTTENFVAELQRHIKIIRTCDNSKLTDCFPPEINGSSSVVDVADSSTYENDSSKPIKTSTLLTAKELGQNTWGTKTVGLQFANGVSAVVAYNPKCSSDPFNNDAVTVKGSKNKITFDTDCVVMVYDTQAFKNPNELNKDIRTSSRARILDSSCLFMIGGKCVKRIFDSVAVTYDRCLELKNNGYGIQTCNFSGLGDRWAGVVQECGSVSKLPTMKQLTTLASYLYDTNINETGRTTSSFDSTTKAQNLGFNFHAYHGDFTIWSNQEYTEVGNIKVHSVKARVFGQYYTETANQSRASDGVYGMCIED